MIYDIDYYKDEIHCLQDENFNLREENAHLGMLNCDLERYLKEHKARIDKAIEYIEKRTKETDFDNDKLIDVLDILKGDYKE